MKVVFFQPYLAAWRIQFLSRFIDDSSHDVTVYDGGFGGKNDQKAVSNNKAEFYFRKLTSWSPVFRISGQNYPFYFSPSLFFHLVYDRPDVVVTEGEINFINNISIYLYCKIFRKKYVWWSLGKVRTRRKNFVNKILDPVVDFLLFRSSCVMARTSWAKKYYVEEKLIPEAKVIVAPNSMDERKARSEVDTQLVEKLRDGVDGAVVLYVGALTEQKRPMDLLQAFSQLAVRPGFENCRLWYVGDGPERAALELAAQQHELIDRICFFGKIFDGVGSYFEASDIVVVPGLGGLVINHAMIFGKPVVSRLADGTELDLVVPGETGYLLSDYKINTLENAIANALSKENLERMSCSARSKVDDFWNIETMISRVNQCIEYSD